MRYRRQFVLCSLIMVCGSLTASGAFADQRTWNTKSGKFSVEAELVDFDESTITLRTAADKEITVERAKLSNEDLSYLEGLEAQKSDELGIRLTVTRFFNALRKNEEQRLEQIREAITQKSREEMEGAGSQIKDLAKPDRSSKTTIRSVDIEGDTAEATVRMRLRGKSILPRLLLRKEEGTWLVYGLIGPNEEEEEETILFEGTESNVGGGNRAPTAQTPDAADEDGKDSAAVAAPR